MEYKNIIESRYDRNAWEALLHDIFKSGANFLATPIEISTDNSIAESSYQLGSITLKDDNKIAVYEIKLSDSVDIVNNRAGIRKLMMSHWKMQGCAGAFMFCYRYNESILRFSYVSSLLKFNDEGKLEKDETDAKRFTYLLGEGHRSRTAIAQFEKLRDSNLMLEDITKAFSVEALSNRFFQEYKEIYEDIVEYATGKRMVKEANRWEEKTIHNPNPIIMREFSRFENPEKSVRDYVKKLMGRIVFLQFLQKKGWLGVPVGKEWGAGDKEFLKTLFDNCQDKANFIDDQLELLFDDINTKRNNDIANIQLGKNIKVPYLNGGLFDLDKEDRCKFSLPVPLMTKLSNFFCSYNFTIDENDPDDAEVGVDPEMLGHIFENLLEDNKDKGAFYTPKSIVQYMCSESLIAYLQNGEAEEDLDSIRNFVKTNDVNYLRETLRPIIDEKLKTVKICDPAIGSGAFPMGLLKELFECRHALESMENICDADIKKHIIQNNIYGVDIEKGAVDIARLRFWLSIVVDEKTPHALPNMDFKIVQGNSLIPTFRDKFINLEDKGRHLNSEKIRDAKKRLNHLQSLFFDSEGELKSELMIEIKYQILEIVKLQMNYEYTLEIDNNLSSGNLFEPEEKKVSKIDEEKNEIAGICRRMQSMLRSKAYSISDKANMILPFFDWKIMFPEVFNGDKNNGFDIVIGNPPYIQLQANDGLLGNMYEAKGFETFARTGDIYCLFYEKGIKLLRPNGHLCFITSNKWMRAAYGEKIRTFLYKKSSPKLLIDFGGLQIFESATVDTNILLTSFSKYNSNTICTYTNKDDKDYINDLDIFVQNNKTICDFSTSNSWVILSALEQNIKSKIEAVGTPLKDWDININYGIKTGFNDAFIISSEKREEILGNCQSNDERERTEKIIRPILRGRDINRYEYNWADLWLINTHNGLKGKLDPINIDDYPAIKGHLDKYWSKISKRSDKGDTPYNLRNCAYLEDFDKPKIIFQEIVQSSQFMYDDNTHFMCIDTCRIIVGENIKFLLGIMNSSLFFYAVKKFYAGGNLGENGVRMKHSFFQYFPCIPVNEQIISITEELISCYSIEKYKQLNNLIYNLYNLTPEEIEYIENN